MVFSWLQNLKQGLIRGQKRQGIGATRGKKMSRFAGPSSSVIVESLEPRQMLSANPIPAGISEIMIDPPGGGTSNQYIELRGTPNATLANGTYLVGVSGVAATAGNVQDIFNLSGLQFGSNGFLVIAQKGETYSVNGSATLRVNSGTGAGFGSDATSSVGHSGISNNLTDGSATYFLMTSNTAPTLSTTIDAAKNGTNGASGLGWTILDSVGVRDNSSDYAYGQINFQNSAGGTSLPGTVVTVGFTPAYVARMETSTGYADSASNPVLHDWVAAGSLSGSAPNFSFSSTAANSSVNVASVAINNIGSYNKYGGGSSGVDSAPVFGSGITKNFTENGIATNLDTSISITDADGTSTSTKSGLLTVTNFVPGEDFLSYSTTAGITGVVDNTNGTITFTAAGGAPLSSWQGALTSVRYQDTSDNPISPDRTVVYQVNDGTYNSPPMVVTIHVIAVNDGPGINAPGAQTTLESTAKTITGLSFTDVDANSGTETVTLSVSHGALSVSTSVANGLTAAMISGNGTGSVTINATLSAINATFANASGLTYTPTQYYNGSDSLSIGINDNGNTGGGALTASASVGITVTSVNSAPSGTSNTITLNEDKPYTFTAADFGFSDAHDTPANALSAVKITTITGGGSLTDNGSAVTNGQQVAVADITGGKLIFTPAANANGTAYAGFLFQVVDDGGTANGGVNTDPSAKSMTINVNTVNDAPLGASKTVTTLEDAAYTFTVADFGFSDPNDTPPNNFQAVKIGTISGAGSLTDNGIAVAANQMIPIADISSGKLVFTPVANANGASYASFTFQVQDDGGTANGGVDTDPTARTMTVNVTSVNDAPSGAAKTVTTLEDTVYTFAVADFGFSDSSDSPPNNFAIVKIGAISGAGALTDNGTAVSAGQLIPVSDISGGKLVFTPAANANGNAYGSFTFQVQDDGGIANGGVNTDPTARTMTVNVTSVNDAPSGASKTVTTLEDTPYTFGVADFGFTDANDSPPNNLSAVKINSISGGGTLADNGTTVTAGQLVSVSDINGGKLIFTPAANANGTAYGSFTFQVQDDGGTSNGGSNTDSTSRTMTVNVTPVNDAPVLSGIEGTTLIYSGTGSIQVTATLTASDVDSPNLASATVKIASGYQNGTDSLSFTNTATLTGSWSASTGTLTITGADTPAKYQAALRSVQFANSGSSTAARTISFVVNDGALNSNSASRVVDVVPQVLSLAPLSPNPGSGSSVQYGLTFSEPVTGVTASAFALSLSGVTGGVINVSGSGANYTLTVTGLSGNGIVGVNLTNLSGITDAGGNGLSTGFTGGYETLLQPGGPVQLVGTALTMNGTSSDDVISVTEGALLDVRLNGVIFLFNPAAVTSIALSGNAGNDSITVNSLNVGTAFSANGGDGNDTITVNSSVVAATTLVGGNGNDTLTGGSGNDSLQGGTGTNVLNGGDGNDAYTLSPRTAADKDTIIDSSGSDSLSFASFANGLTLNLQTVGAQTIDSVSGYQVDLQGVFETVFAGTGNDMVTGNATVGTTIYGGNGNNTLTGGSGNDVLVGGTGNDTLLGLGGNDQLQGGTGNNVLNGGDGNDTYVPAARTSADKDTIVDSSGTDSLLFAAFTNNLTLNLQTVGPQTIDAVSGYQVDLQGTFESVTLGSGNDTATGNASIGTTIYGGSGNNTLTGGSGNDVLVGGTGNDTLIGMGGNDTLQGGTGTNILNGGDGNDSYSLAARTSADKDTIIDSSGTDSLSFTSFLNGLIFSLQTVGSQTADAVSGYQIDLQGTFETVSLGAGNNVVTGNATVGTTIIGGAGTNILIGGSGNDMLVGGVANDILIGGLGTDTLTGNANDDILIGGTLSFANNLAGLLAIQQEWTSANSYATRVANLKGAPGGQNGAFFLNSSTVTLGTAKDTLTGGAGNDWFWANAIDTKDLVAGEQLN